MFNSIFLIIYSIFLFIIIFIKDWYSDVLFDSCFILYPILSFLIAIIFVIYLILLIKKLNDIDKGILDYIPIIIIIITLIFHFKFPFRETKTIFELEFYEKDRLKIIEMVKSNQLEIDENGNASLPNNYKHLATSGEIRIYKNNNDDQVISFWIFRGMLSGSIELVYSSSDEYLIKKNERRHPISSIKKLKEHWYYVETDY